MSIKINGLDLQKRIINGQEVEKVMYNGVQIRPDVVPPTPDYLCFTGTAGSSIALAKVGSPYAVNLEISYDKTTWSDYTFGVQINYDSNINKVYFRNKSTTPTYFSTTSNNYYKFYMSGSISASGDITMLLCKDGTTTLTSDYCFFKLFYDCTVLITPPRLPAMTLTYGCYSMMFHGCTSLTTAPELPATTLAEYCYERMFHGCTSLTTAPELPATTLAESCYERMFYGCTSLTTAPELPVTTLARSCYYSMFSGCTSLTTAPELPATTLARSCYYSMFSGCTSLTTIPLLPATTLADYCYYTMFSSCTSIKLSETQTGEYQTPYRIPTNGTGIEGRSSFWGMFSNTGGRVSTPTINQQYWTSNTVI